MRSKWLVVSHAILLTGLVLLCGCSMTKDVIDAQALCASDPQCLEQTKKYAKIGETIASPFGPVASAGAGSAITAIALAILGWRKKKKQPEITGSITRAGDT